MVQIFTSQQYMVVNTTSGLYYKSFMIVIYDRNDSGQYYKTDYDRNLRS